mgnify:CR=1 FL=1
MYELVAPPSVADVVVAESVTPGASLSMAKAVTVAIEIPLYPASDDVAVCEIVLVASPSSKASSTAVTVTV